MRYPEIDVSGFVKLYHLTDGFFRVRDNILGRGECLANTRVPIRVPLAESYVAARFLSVQVFIYTYRAVLELALGVYRGADFVLLGDIESHFIA